ncbi:MAG: PQQ-binding-like beta-propeller repeat protein [Bacteroidales bacterium]|jgi:outer membrane protein assembly factor BamB|nr:PQQ-binding-like beta-propeller repeat protein [Bacteroidales bacterium]
MLLITACLYPLQTEAQNSQWRGANRDGVYGETGLLKSWAEGGPQLLWETLETGKGYSSPAIAGNRLYVTGLDEDENKELFFAFTLDGTKIYETEYGTPWKESYSHARTTPAVVNGKAYVISGSGEIACIDTENGKIVWSVDGGTKFERKTGNWGTSECPLVFDNKVIYTPSGDQTTMVALNAETGETIWKSPALGDIGAYVSPMQISYKGKRQILGITGVNVIGVNPDSGTVEWSFNDWGRKGDDAARPKAGKIAPNTPLYKDGCIFVSQGYDMGSFMLKLNDDLSGVSLVWRNADFDTHIGGYVLIDDIIYGSNWINNGQGNWIAADWNTGETKYNEAWSGGASKGAVITADNMLYCYDERRGTVGLVKAIPEKFDVVSSFRITRGEGPHWAHPVISEGVLYIRHGSALMAYKIK